MLTFLRQQPIALLALFVALGGTSVAAVSAKRAGGEARNVVQGCVGENTGRLRIVSSAANCGTLETPISFNREGKHGRRGATGKPGGNGKDGAAGQSGAQGVAGLTGLAGQDGANGGPGAAGADGLQGLAGGKGDAGEQGDPGENGTNGDPGEKGDAGENGVNGTNGDPGEKGDAGENGVNGEQGEQGDAGPAGTIGGAAAGGALTGTYPDPQLAPDSVGTETIAADSINLSKLGTDIGSLVIDPPSLAAGVCSRIVVPGVPQALQGEFALMIPINALSAGIIIEPAFVSTPGVVPVTVCNNSAGTIDQGNISFRARLIPRS